MLNSDLIFEDIYCGQARDRMLYDVDTFEIFQILGDNLSDNYRWRGLIRAVWVYFGTSDLEMIINGS